MKTNPYIHIAAKREQKIKHHHVCNRNGGLSLKKKKKSIIYRIITKSYKNRV